MGEHPVFNNRYRLDNKLGAGGMATVYCGTDTLLRRRVAIKVLHEQYASDEEFVRRFYQEAESAAKLSHPNIVATYDVGREGSLYYIVMELVDGPSLGELIAADGRLPEPVAIDYAAQICSGLAYAHRQGLLHRDIKPANILVTKDDVVKISDFGIARAVSTQTMALTKPGLVMGSVHYISPEQAQGHDLHESSDLYSVGIVLYEMLVGKLPYNGESPVTVALKHIGDPVPQIDAEATGTSPALASIVNRLLQKRPENRFQSAEDVASALRAARERPSRAAYGISDDAPTQQFAAQQLPPRRSPLPDRPFTSLGEDEQRRSRTSSRIVATLIVLMLAATAIGYALFGRHIPSFAAHQIRVGNYKDMTYSQAEKQLENLGLAFKVTQTPSDTVPANQIISQNPEAGTAVDPDATIELFVSNGRPVVGLQDVTGFTYDDAMRVLKEQKFKVKEMHRFDAAQKPGAVIAMSPKAGSSVRQGSLVTLTVSDGPKPLQMPSLLGLSVAQAQALAAKDGFALDSSQSAPNAQYPAGQIAAQDVASGTTIDTQGNLVVHVTVSSGMPAMPAGGPSVAVPDVRGRNYGDAVSTIAKAGLTPDVAYEVQSSANGTIVGENPAPDSQIAQGAHVTLTVSVSGEIPDVVNLSVSDAEATLQAAGYPTFTIRHTTLEGANGKAVRTEPDAGSTVSPTTPITLIVNGP